MPVIGWNIGNGQVKNGIHKEKPKLQRKESEKIETMFDFLGDEHKNGHAKIFHNDQMSQSISDYESVISYGSIELKPTTHDIHKFASVYFIGNATLHFSKHPLKQSLLELLPHDELVSSIFIYKIIVKY